MRHRHSTRGRDNDNRNITYRCARLPTNHADTKSDPNLTPNLNPTAKQHAIVSIQLIIVARRAHTDEFIRDKVVAPFVPTFRCHGHAAIEKLVLAAHVS